jgi:malonyl-CoA/methylmalonyl-CoA synthetase
MNVLDLLAIPVAEVPAKVALAYRDPATDATVRLSYGELATRVEAVAAELAAHGLENGDRVALFLSNRPDFAVVLLAAFRLGAIVVPMNLAYRGRELGHLLADSRARLLVTEDAQLPLLAELGIGDAASGGPVTVTVETLGRSSRPNAAPPPLPRFGEPLAMLLYTSGTTGQSKGAMLSHQNLLATISGLLAAWAWRRDDTLLLTLPLFHTHGLVVGLLTALAAGATVDLRRRFEAAAVAADLAAGIATVFFGVPTMYVRLVEELDRRKAAGEVAGFAGVRLFASGSAPLAAETFDGFAMRTGQHILERYGMTETGMNLSNPYAGPRLAGTVGRPLPGVSIRIADGSDDDLAPGSEGELLVAGSNVFRGYWQSPEKTAASFLHDATGRQWFRTGDLARLDPTTGHVTLLGRRHELIIRGGFNIYPREIEEVLLSVPGVREAAVIGEKNVEWGEVPVAVVVTDVPLADRGAFTADLLAECQRQLARFKVPATVRFVDELPRNALGKVLKHLLK